MGGLTYQWVRVIILVAGISGTSLAAADEGSVRINELPRGFVGEFQWEGDPTVQLLSIQFESVRALDSQDAEADGCGVYDTNGHITAIKVKMVVRWSDLSMELFEETPEGDSGFETDGSHVGHLSKDLQAIDARWTTRTTGQIGELHLRASPAATCTPGSAV